MIAASSSCVPAAVKTAPLAGVEERAVFEQAHGFADGVERAAAVGEHALAGAQHRVQRGVVFGFGAGPSTARMIVPAPP